MKCFFFATPLIPEHISINLFMMNIRRFRPEDIDFATACTAAEGWTGESREVLDGFFHYDPEGCFLAERGGKRAGICIAVNYGRAGFIGELVVAPQARGGMIGPRLLDTAIDYLHSKGAEDLYLDGVLAAAPYYKNVGFRPICRSRRFVGLPPSGTHPSVRLMRKADMDAVVALDRIAFGADRSFFLRLRFQLYPRLTRVYESGGLISGFVMGLETGEKISVGPWIADERCEEPAALLQSLAADADRPMRIGILETHEQGINLIQSLGGFQEHQYSLRMCMGSGGYLGRSAQAFAVCSPAMG